MSRYLRSLTNILLPSYVLLIVTHFGDAVLQGQDVPQEAQLKKDLLQHYDSSVRPIYNSSHPIQVTIDLALHQIIDVDEKQQSLHATVWMRLVFIKCANKNIAVQIKLLCGELCSFSQYWTDEFIAWNSSEYGGVETLKFDPSQLWVPDLCIYDGLEPAIYSNDMQDFYISVDSDGNVMWLSPLVITTMCRLNVRFFPYDSQICNITIGSWMYHGFEVDIWNQNIDGDITELKDNIEWEVQGFNATRKVSIFGCCPEPYPVVVFRIYIERLPGFYITYLYLPCVVIIATSLFSFYLPPGSDSKIDLAVNGLLSQTVFLLLISDLLPPDANDPPYLGRCLAILLVIQAVAVVAIVIVKRLHDDWMCKTDPPGRKLATIMHYLKYPLLLWSLDFRHDTESKLTSTNSAGVENNNDNILFNGTKSSKQHASTTDNKVVPVADQLSTTDIEGLSPPGRLAESLDRIIKEVQRAGERIKEQEKLDEAADQWRMVVAVCDRLLFVAFLIGILVITVWFLTLQRSL